MGTARSGRRATAVGSGGTATKAPNGAAGDRTARSFEVLELLAGHPDGLTLTEIVGHLGLPGSSAHNLLRSLAAADIVQVGDDLRYGVGARAVGLAIRIVGGLDIRTAAERPLQDLARETGEDIYLATRMGRRVSYIERVHGTSVVSVDIRLGQSLYLHATSVGKLFAAHTPLLRKQLFSSPRPRLTPRTLTGEAELERELAVIRRAGHAISREEAIPGIVGIAVPVHDAADALVAAVHVSTLGPQLTRTRLHQLIAAAGVTAARIERDLGRLQHGGGGPAHRHDR